MRRWLEEASMGEIEQVLQDAHAGDPIYELAQSEQTLRRTLVPVGRPIPPPTPDGSTRAIFWMSLAAAAFSLLALVVSGLSLQLQLRAPSVPKPVGNPVLSGGTPTVIRPGSNSPGLAAPTALDPRPLATPPSIAATTTPSAAPTALPDAATPEDFAARVRASQERAIVKHPELAQARSPLNARFVAVYQRLKLSGSPRLEEPDWPEKLAAECAADLSADNTLPER